MIDYLFIIFMNFVYYIISYHRQQVIRNACYVCVCSYAWQFLEYPIIHIYLFFQYLFIIGKLHLFLIIIYSLFLLQLTIYLLFL